MDTSDLIKDNPHKQRTIDDIVRFLKTRVEKNPNYCLLLGAGCSVTSGIPSGGELIDKWRREIFTDHSETDEAYSTEAAKKILKEKFSQWYSETNEYSSLFEKKYDLPSQRRKFIEELVSEKTPSIGYAYLVNLVKNNYLNSIFTTNFDDLLNEAFYHYSDRRPMLCAHDSSVNSINLYSSRPKIIKLHGDYLFDDIKGSLRETESLEQNTKNKLVETLKGQGLISVGYGGYDRSVMDVISYLLRLDDHLTNGVYWCIRKGETISEEVRKLLWRDKVYYVLIDGFDEFFAELNLKLTNGLSLEQNLTNNKTSKIIESYTSNNYLLQSNSTIIQSDIERLSKQKTKSNISRLIQELTEKDTLSKLDDNELAALMTIETLIQDKNYSEAITRCTEELSKLPDIELRTSLTALQAKAYILADLTDKAIECNEKLKQLEPNDSTPYIAISSIESNTDKKIKILKDAISVAPYDYLAYDKLAYILIDQASHSTCTNKKQIQEAAKDAITKSLDLNPAYTNPSWGKLYDLENTRDAPPADKKTRLFEIVNELDRQGPFNSRSITLKSSFYSDHGTAEDQKEYFEQLQEHETSVKKKSLLSFKNELLKTASKFRLDEISKRLIDEILEEADENKDSDSIITAGVVLAEQFGKFTQAIDIISNAKNDTFDSLRTLIICQALTNDQEGAEKNLKKIKEDYTQIAYLRVSSELYDFIGQPEKSLQASKLLIELTNDKNKYISIHAYNHIKNKDIETAKKILSDFLNDNNFDRNLVSEIVNFEICKVKLGGKCDKARLNEILSHTSSKLAKAAVHTLLDDIPKALDLIRDAIREDKTDITSILHWPAFDTIRSDRDFMQIVESALSTISSENSSKSSTHLRVV